MVGYMVFYIALMALISRWMPNSDDAKKAENNILHQKTVNALNKLKTAKQNR